MIRAIFFDFYSVWTPDKISYYLASVELKGPEDYKEMCDIVENYYQGKVDVKFLADNFRMKLSQPEIDDSLFELNKNDISPVIVNFMRSLHGHFLKLGILANLGAQELKILNDFNLQNEIFEVIASPLSYKMPVPLLSKELFARALQDIGEPLDNSLLVSGNLPLLEFATSLGISVVQFEGFTKLKEELEKIIVSEIPE